MYATAPMNVILPNYSSGLVSLLTPTLLSEFARHTQGVSVQVNRELVVNNARLAGEIATSLASL